MELKPRVVVVTGTLAADKREVRLEHPHEQGGDLVLVLAARVQDNEFDATLHVRRADDSTPSFDDLTRLLGLVTQAIAAHPDAERRELREPLERAADAWLQAAACTCAQPELH